MSSDEDTSPDIVRYRNKNTRQVVEYDRPNPRLEFLQNWETLPADWSPDDDPGSDQRSARGNMLGSSSIGDRLDDRHQIPVGTWEPEVKLTETGSPPEQTDVVTADPAMQVKPKTGDNKRVLRVAEPDDTSSNDDEPDPDHRPAKTDNKPAWVDWAVECGSSREDAEAMTKTELIDVYG